MRTLIWAAASLIVVSAGSQASFAADAPVHKRTAEEQRNVDRAVYLTENVLGKNRIDQIKDYVAPTWVEHHPSVDGNLDAAVAFFKNLAAQSPPPQADSGPRNKVLFSFAEGDLVALVVLRQEATDPAMGPDKFGQLGLEVLRMKDGKQVEHWDEQLKLTPGALATQPNQLPPLPGKR
jgi:predicted SnoaL-like aldol condensation-catalyzing enzyme